MRWFRKKCFFFLFYGERAAHTRLFLKLVSKIGRSRAKITLITMMKNWPTWLQTVNSNSLTKRQSEGPYVMPSISRVFCFNPERFSSFSRHATRRGVTTYFLSSLPCDDSTIAVNKKCKHSIRKSYFHVQLYTMFVLWSLLFDNFEFGLLRRWPVTPAIQAAFWTSIARNSIFFT